MPLLPKAESTAAPLPGREEERFAETVRQYLEDCIGTTFNVRSKRNLLYRLEIDENGEVRPKQEEWRDPTRGQLYAFQTDVLIEKKQPEIPVVVLELKLRRFSTHDVITYSSKASRHKEIYPYLRYGFIVGGVGSLSKKFLAHNQAIDFAAAINDLVKDGPALVDLVKRQAGDAEKIIALMRNRRDTFISYEKKLDVRV